MAPTRQMLDFADDTGHRFNCRVAGIIIRDGHVLVCREDDDEYVMLPGGRLERRERSDLALAREIEEELGVSGQVDRLLFMSETFFIIGGEEFHQLALYYHVTLPDDFPFAPGAQCLETEDEGHLLKFYWVPATEVALGDIALEPRWLHTELEQLPDSPRHLIRDER